MTKPDFYYETHEIRSDNAFEARYFCLNSENKYQRVYEDTLISPSYSLLSECLKKLGYKPESPTGDSPRELIEFWIKA